jgi:hypothetical protein
VNIAQASEKSISVGRKHYISRLSRERGFVQVSHPPIQNAVACAFKYDGGKAKIGDLNPSDETTLGDGFFRNCPLVQQETVEFAITLYLLEVRVNQVGTAVSQDHEPGR